MSLSKINYYVHIFEILAFRFKVIRLFDYLNLTYKSPRVMGQAILYKKGQVWLLVLGGIYSKSILLTTYN